MAPWLSDMIQNMIPEDQIDCCDHPTLRKCNDLWYDCIGILNAVILRRATEAHIA